MLLDHNRNKLEINNKEIWEPPNIWKLNMILLKTHRSKKPQGNLKLAQNE